MLKNSAFIAVLFIGFVVVSACSQVTQPTPMPSTNPSPTTLISTVAPTPSIEPTATVFVTPSPTPIPTLLPTLIPRIAVNDVAIQKEQFVLQITKLMLMSQLGDFTVNTDKRILVLFANLLNYSTQPQTFHDEHFYLIESNGSKQKSNVAYMRAAAKEFGSDLSPCCVLANSVIERERFTVGALSWKSTYLAFEIPANVDEGSFELEFAIPGKQENQRMGLFYAVLNDDYIVFNITENGKFLLQDKVQFVQTVRTIYRDPESLIDVQTSCVSHQGDQAPIELHFTRKKETFYSVVIEQSSLKNASDAVNPLKLGTGVFRFLPGLALAAEVIESLIADHYTITKGETITQEQVANITVKDRGVTMIYVSWRRSTVEGELQFDVRGYLFAIPYTVTNGIHMEVIQKPVDSMEQCNSELSKLP